ncbi:MAG TPA: CAP domain-containing protein [Candidatus Eisenbacteria bacterium]|nr:CAP domain-containing protein [Candidatus Eisenbacteria bacterium]
MNEYRASKGLRPLIWHRGLASVARGHSKDMVARHFFSHENPDGLRARDRLAVAGIAYAAMGENIAYGHATGAAVLNAWLKSSGHRHNIEDPAYTHHGVGKVGTHWTHVFLRPRTKTTASR